MSSFTSMSDTLYDPPPPRRARANSVGASVFSSSRTAVSRDDPGDLIPDRKRRNSFANGDGADVTLSTFDNRARAVSSSTVPVTPPPPPFGGSRFTDGDKQIQTPLTNLYDDLDRSHFRDLQAANRGAGVSSDTDSDSDGVVYDGPGAELGAGPAAQARGDRMADLAVRREGRRSKVQEMKEDPDYHPSAFIEDFHHQLYDLTHSIDELENDIDAIVNLRNKVATLSPKEDPGQVSLKADLSSLSSMTTETGRRIVMIEQWLSRLYIWMKDLRRAHKQGEISGSLKDIAEVKYQLSTAKMDFADAMERIREGAWKEEERRERTRIWMARHMRWREPEMQDDEVRKLLKAAELGAADGVAKSDVTSYAGLWALRNPFTELAEITHGLEFMKDALDREIVDTVTGKNLPRRVISFDQGKPRVPVATFPPQPSQGAVPGSPMYKYYKGSHDPEILDFEWEFARKQQLQRSRNRKKMVIAVLLVIIFGLIVVIWIASLKNGTRGASHPFLDGEDESMTADHRGTLTTGVESLLGAGLQSNVAQLTTTGATRPWDQVSATATATDV